MTETVDALVYAEIPNNLTGTQLLQKGMTGVTSEEASDILTETTIKRACCINKKEANQSYFPVNVRIPVPEGYVYSAGNPLAETWKKFSYIDKVVHVPISMCGELPSPNGQQYYSTDAEASNACYTFMNAYCNNVNEFYTDEVKKLGTPYDATEFTNYKPECACYAEAPSYITTGVPPACWATGCGANTPAFLDYESATKECDMTICNANFNLANIHAGGNVTIASPKIVQKCGNPPPPPHQENNPTEEPKINADQEPTIKAEQEAKIKAEQEQAIETAKFKAKEEAAAKGLNAEEEKVAIEEAIDNAKKRFAPRPTSESSGISTWFSKSKNYMGYILIIICICLLICCCFFFMRRKRKYVSDDE